MDAQIIYASPENVFDIVEIENPGFETSYPNIVFPERLDALPVGARHFLDHCWLRGRFPETVTKVMRLRDVFISGEGLVFNRDLELFLASRTQQSELQICLDRDKLAVSIRNQALTERDGPSILCVKPGQKNYGHWLVEMLPKADIAIGVYPDLKPLILVPSADEPMRSVIERSLELLKIGKEAVIPSLVCPEWCEELIIVHGLTEHGIYMSPMVFRTLDRLAAGVAEQSVTERVYVKRSPPSVRCLANEEIIGERLRERGFTTLHPETMTLDQQIATFRGARHVAGVAGAGFANLAFCRPGAEATIFYPENMADTFYWFLAQHRGLTFNDIRCRPSGETRSHMPWDADIVLEPKLFTWYMQS